MAGKKKKDRTAQKKVPMSGSERKAAKVQQRYGDSSKVRGKKR